MPPRDTRTGRVLEAMILPSLQSGGYEYRTQQAIGQRFGGGRHVVDAIAEKDGRRYLVSLKWQQVSGTAEQKVPFEVICLAEAVRRGAFNKAYLVLGGEGWKLRAFYTGGGLSNYLVAADQVDIRDAGKLRRTGQSRKVVSQNITWAVEIQHGLAL